MWFEFLSNDDPEFKNQIGLSIGARYLGQPRREYSVEKGKYITYLPDLLLYEVSLTPKPINPETYTWSAAVMKSMDSLGFYNGGSGSGGGSMSVYELKPDSVVYDPKRGVLAIKSTVEGANGQVYQFDQYINLQKDVIKAMDDIKDKEEQKKPPTPAEGASDAPPAEGEGAGGAVGYMAWSFHG